ncbi:MAG TPA: MFS transporter [Usitatibacter sp.]|nr:MFS transporter [Usitatibacter sp.]
MTAQVAPRFTIVLLSLAAFASAASMRVTDAMLPRLASHFAIGIAQAANVITVFAVAYGAFQVAFGPLGDRFGKLRVIGLAGVGAAAATVACLVAPSYGTFVVARFVAGAFCGGIIPLSMAWLGDVVPYAERQPVLARFLLGQILGLGSGAAVGGFAADQGAWRWPFAALAAWLLATAVMLLFAARRDPVPRKAGGRHFAHDLGLVFAVPWARVVVATVFVEGIVVFGALAFVPTHLHDARGFSLSTAGLATLVFAGGGVLFALFARPLVRRLGEVGLAIAGTCLIAAGFALVGWTPRALAAPGGCLLAGLGFYMLHNTLQANATQMAPERRGAGMALFASLYFVGQALGVAAAGHVAQASRPGVVIFAACLAILPVGFTFARLRRLRV